jgi:pimeloyl-ACP methyl ester carboxylesterase
VVTYDRPGWGRSEAPDDYRRTSIPEQSIAAAGVLHERGVAGARILGVGFGAVVALELALAEPGLVESAVLVEPPLFDMLTRATEGMSDDVAAIREAAEQGGEEAVWRLYLAGGLTTLGAGAERLAGIATGAGPEAPHTLLVELPAVPAWPLDPVRVSGLEPPVSVATMPSSPGLLVDAADSVIPRIPGAGRELSDEDGAAAVPGLLGRP